MANKKLVTPISVRRQTSAVRRVAAYCRVSSPKEEQMHSLAAQVHYYEQLLSGSDDCEFAGIYADEGISGTSTRNRTEFLRLIEDCRAGKINEVITKSVSRFGRNTVDTLVFTRELRQLGVDVFFEKENLHSCSREGELLLTLMAAIAESEAVSMSDNIKWGKRRRYEKGLVESLAIANIFGFRKNNDTVVAYEPEAAVVRRIYKEFLDGHCYAEIAKGLLADGVPTKRPDAKWANKTVMNILQNEKYCGDCRFQKTYIQDPITHISAPNRGELPQFFVEDCLPAIIDRETWYAVQELRTRHCRVPKPPSSEYPFRGLLYCGTCGKPFAYHYYCSLNRKQMVEYRCSSWRSSDAVEVPGMLYTPPHKAGYNMTPSAAMIEYRERYNKKPEPRQMLCTDIRIPLERPEKSFVRVWNLMVSKKTQYQATLRRTADTTDNALVRYRAKEMIALIDDIGKIDGFDYALMVKTVDHIEVTPAGKLAFLFQSGIRITV